MLKRSANFEFSISEDEGFSTKFFHFYVEEGTKELTLRIAPGKDVGLKNELKVLVYDPCGEFRGWLDPKRYEILLSAEKSSSNGVKGYIPFGEWTLFVETGTISHASRYRIETLSQVDKIHENWYLGELHSHTTKSDGEMDLNDLAQEAKKHELDFLFVSDHDVPLLCDDELPNDELKILPAVEITTYKGHALALGVQRHVPPQSMIESPEFSSKLVRSEGGIFGIAHPFFPPSPYCSGCRWSYGFIPTSVDFLELWNSGGVASQLPAFNLAALSLWTEFLNEGFRISATSGGDIHRKEDFNDFWLPFHVRSDELSLKALICSIKAGRGHACRGKFLFEVFHEGKRYRCGDVITAAEDDILEIRVNSELADEILLLSSAGAMKIDASSFDKKFQSKDVRWLSVLALHNEKIVGFSNPIFLKSGKESS